jgi:hypothetical protein
LREGRGEQSDTLDRIVEVKDSIHNHIACILRNDFVLFDFLECQIPSRDIIIRTKTKKKTNKQTKNIYYRFDVDSGEVLSAVLSAHGGKEGAEARHEDVIKLLQIADCM